MPNYEECLSCHADKSRHDLAHAILCAAHIYRAAQREITRDAR